MVLAALIYTHPDETYLVTAPDAAPSSPLGSRRHFYVAGDIQQAVERIWKPRTAPPPLRARPPRRRVRAPMASRAERPTLQAGFSCPKVAAGSKAVVGRP